MRILCAVLAVLSALAASTRDVDLGLCLCGTAPAASADTCCPVEAHNAEIDEDLAAMGSLQGLRCIELHFTGSAIATDATRTGDSPPSPPLPVFTARTLTWVAETSYSAPVAAPDAIPGTEPLPAPVTLRI